MDYEELNSKLNSVGKRVFVEYFTTFKEFSEGVISLDEMTEIFMLDGVSTEGGTVTRCRNAKLIFEQDLECEALTLLAESNKLSEATVIKAQEILLEYCYWSKHS